MPSIATMKTTSNYSITASGFLIGVICATVCVVLFAVFESVRMAALEGSFAFEDMFSVVFDLAVIYGSLFAFVPAGFGGYILELVLRNRSKKGVLTEKWATIAGILVAGSAVMAACGIGIAVLILVPHHYWRHFLTDIMNGSFFADVQYHLDYLIKFLSRMFLEIMVASILACTSGAVTGKYLAKRINRSQIS
jgi:hypothetical protein